MGGSQVSVGVEMPSVPPFVHVAAVEVVDALGLHPLLPFINHVGFIWLNILYISGVPIAVGRAEVPSEYVRCLFMVRPPGMLKRLL